MKLRLGIVNFQSLERAKFLFEPGFTLITGPTSSGKTAVFRALRHLILNPVAAVSKIRYGTTETQVALKVDEGLPILWKRTEKSGAYHIGTQEFSKIGRTKIYNHVPSFPLLYDEAKNRLSNVHSEWDKLFPFDRSPSEVFTLFEEIFHISSSSLIFQSMKRDETTAKARLDNLKAQRNILASKIQAVQKEIDEKRIFKLRDYREKFLEDSKMMTELGKDLRVATSLGRSLEASQNLVKKSFDVIPLESEQLLLHDLLLARRLSAQLQVPISRRDIDTTPLEVEGISRDLRNASALSSALQIAALLPDKRPEFFQVEWEHLRTLEKDREFVEFLTRELNESVEETRNLTALKESLKAKLSEFKECPTCGQRLDHTH